MRVLMFGWEFPPFNRGGLGVACHGLTKALTQQGVDITFVMPKAAEKAPQSHVNLVMQDVRVENVDSPLCAYMSEEEYHAMPDTSKELYGKTLFEEVQRYAEKASEVVQKKTFDVIHAHDWMTFQAGLTARTLTGKPLILHVHATEFDRAGGKQGNQRVHQIEQEAMQQADKIIAVSHFTKEKIMKQYGIPGEKIEVVHNGIEFNKEEAYTSALQQHSQIVLFLGRLTMQKGPEWFIEIARKVLQKKKNVRFIMAGSGEMGPQMINRVAELGLSTHILFAGYLRGQDIDRAYRMADLYVMPSVSEPFGLTPLEAMRNGTPVLISKQSGVSEVVKHCLKADFWDVEDMANKIIAALQYPSLQYELKHSGLREVHKFGWNGPAAHVRQIYKEAMQ